MSTTDIQLIVGLGNPGSRYERTRHNAGFWFVDELAQRHGGNFQRDNKFSAEVCRLTIEGHDVRLLKPDTWMNESGRAVQAIAKFFKIPATSILVAYDEIDLPPGKIRLKKGGGHGGHNGVRDVVSQIGADFVRLRIGVGHPGRKDLVTNFVLGSPSKEEENRIVTMIDDAVAVVPILLDKGLEQATHKLHSKKTAPAQDKSQEKSSSSASKKAQKPAESINEPARKTSKKKPRKPAISRRNADNDDQEEPSRGSFKDQLMALLKRKK